MSSPVQLLRVPGLAPVPYAYAAVVDPTRRLVLTAGACPLDADGRTVAVGDPVGQAERVLDNLTATLAAAGAGLTDVVRTTVYVASSDRADLGAVWEVVADRFGDHDVPSTLLGVAALGWPDQLVEIEAVAVADSEPVPPADPR
ncbi:enamine deaminase RidA (YjgF/YER057c/UK114 family) [Friedmanniella endophytica]|uniref:Enamine deaminase RidA (YjgF/YER057c/UK114 family) n=1 Tax=Microlunatus kandeliicorticis TaxID=1759536 RepID=A0A7W3IRW2_9ACTN|nr:Rid family hydrolase [Microlunatus kandeliicorticis]MBA8794126.1 enamine deaminase RidA (YjgF/YER057c/UK114 family) [Microlunatus kandeliicorticis]